MGRKQNNIYKKPKAFRDFRKFVIVAEGEREDDYFAFFNEINGRVQIAIAPREGGKSAAKYLLERANKYIEKEGLVAEDYLWFVLDIDRWPRKEIENLLLHCEKNHNWSIAISNPSFEIWLYFHFGDPTKLRIKTAKQLKTKLDKLVHGGYKREVYAKEIERAKNGAQKADKHPKQGYPDFLRTKVWKLAEEMLKFLGRNWKRT